MLYIFGKQTGGNVGDYCFPEPRQNVKYIVPVSEFQGLNSTLKDKITSLLSLIHEKFIMLD